MNAVSIISIDILAVSGVRSSASMTLTNLTSLLFIKRLMLWLLQVRCTYYYLFYSIVFNECCFHWIHLISWFLHHVSFVFRCVLFMMLLNSDYERRVPNVPLNFVDTYHVKWSDWIMFWINFVNNPSFMTWTLIIKQWLFVTSGPFANTD